MIKKNILQDELFFDFPKPSNQNQGREYLNENSQQQEVNTKVEDQLDENLFDPTEVIKKLNEEEGENIYCLEKLKPEYAMMIF